MTQKFRSGFVGLVGPTNSGKSTFLNAAVGSKVSIVSHLPQTTLRTVRGIVNRKDFQLIFVDTPGLQRRSELMSGSLNRVANEHAKECDLLLWMFDVSSPHVERQINGMHKLAKKWKPPGESFCLLNKIDQVAKPSLLPMMAKIADFGVFSEIVPISARDQDGVERVVRLLGDHLPEGELLYPSDQKTDRSREFQISELIREKIYQVTRQELPYSVWIEVDPLYEDPEERVPNIYAVVHADSDSRKGILIGKQGSLMKEVGIRARKDIENLLGYQVCLKLRVNVHKEWRSDKRHVKGYLELE